MTLTGSTAALSGPAALGAKHQRRIELLLLFGCSITIGTGVLWGTFFLLRKQWAIIPLEFAVIVLGVLGMWLTMRKQVHAAALLVTTGLYLVISSVCLFLDVPTPGVPRSSHQFFISLGACAYLMLRGNRPWLRNGVILLLFSTYAVFDSSNIGFVTPYNLPEDARALCTWGNNAIMLVVLFMAMSVMQADVAAANELETELRAGLSEGQFVLHYQPQVAANGEVIGAEALVRWLHPRHGMVPPSEFIPMAERTGLILPLGEWVLRQACAQLAEWSRLPETSHIKLSVNMSARQFRQPDFVAQVASVVERCGVNPARLKIELTESVLASDLDDIVAKMTQLKARGVGFSLDDFGTGYSSLSYLTRLPLDQLKIDRAFVNDLLTNANDAAVAQTVVKLGQTLGLEVIAEGVENEGQRGFLSSIGCHAFQGFLSSKPLPLADFNAFVAARLSGSGQLAMA